MTSLFYLHSAIMVAIGALVLDYVIGDPRSKLHPVVLIGNLISFFEKIFYRKKDRDTQKLFKGAILVVCVLIVVYQISFLLLNSIEKFFGKDISFLAQIIVLSFMISPRSLKEAGQEIYSYLIQKNLEQARFKVGWIVGRDTQNLSPEEVTRATVETIAENTIDGVISPLFYFFIGGVPLAVAYRAANTMDSMLGYKNEKYLFFGRVAAKADDLWNYVPARLTGWLMVVAAWVLNFDWKNAKKFLLQDASKHPSPNGGHAEATVAGALGIRLGGENFYFGERHFRAYMGEKTREMIPQDISNTSRIMYTTTILFLLFMSLLEILLYTIVFYIMLKIL